MKQFPRPKSDFMTEGDYYKHKCTFLEEQSILLESDLMETVAVLESVWKENTPLSQWGAITSFIEKKNKDLYQEE